MTPTLAEQRMVDRISDWVFEDAREHSDASPEPVVERLRDYSAIAERLAGIDGESREELLAPLKRAAEEYLTIARRALEMSSESPEWVNAIEFDPGVEFAAAVDRMFQRAWSFARDFAWEREYADWDESKHPRHPEGSSQGGEFAPKGSTTISGEGEIGGGSSEKLVHDTISKAFEPAKKDVAAIYDGQVRRLFERMQGSLGPNLKGVHNSFEWARVFNETVRPNVERVVQGLRAEFTDPYRINETKLAANAARYGEMAVTESVIKATGKLPGISKIAAWYKGGNTYLVQGEIKGKKVRLDQQMIINVSSKGKLFNQFPALIYVDGKKVSEKQFKEGKYAEEYADWDESEHPRQPKGDEKGGEFAPKGNAPVAAKLQNSMSDVWRWAEDKAEGARKSSTSLVVSNYLDLASLARKARDSYKEAKSSYENGQIVDGDAHLAKAKGFQDRLIESAGYYKIKLPKIKKYADPPKLGRLPDSAQRYFRTKRFWVTGLVGKDLTREAQAIILAGMKSGAGVDTIVSRLRDSFDHFTDARLSTIVRTNVTDAYNQGVLVDMRSPQMQGIVKAVEYVAVLDDRTTELCSYLDGTWFRLGDPRLDALNPPNHFNCRSVLSPVVYGMRGGRYLTGAKYRAAQRMIPPGFGGTK